MSSHVRRLAVVLALLGVLVGTFGPAHVSCGPDAAPRLASALGWSAAGPHAAPAHHPPAEGAHGAHGAHCAGGPADDGSSRTPSPERSGLPAGEGCAPVAHCVTWTVATTAVAVGPSLPLPDVPRPAHDALLPLGPDAEPDHPPPRA